MELYRKVYDKTDLDEGEWMEWWSWQHERNPAGPPIIWFADAGDRLAGQYEVVRIGMKVPQ